METGPFGDIFPTEKGDIPLLCHIMNLPEGKKLKVATAFFLGIRQPHHMTQVYKKLRG